MGALRPLRKAADAQAQAPPPMQGRSSGALRPLRMVGATPEPGKLGVRSKSLS